ncbi:MAG TPA: MBL fold metallo-hydrolase [Steroidobacteraceae bacterium]
MSELEPGKPVRIAATVQRLVAPNASMMTGPGTNSYVLGDPPVAVLDPGPDSEPHLEALLRAAPRIEQIFVTHTHADHSTAAAVLAARTGAKVIGLPPPKDGRQDESCRPDVQPRHDEVFRIGESRLRAIFTPGHASNHVCFLLEDEGLLFSGDHVLDGVTPVILAPDGDMSAYMDSMRRLREYDIRAIAPGHGRVLTEPRRAIDVVIAHRERREAKVFSVLETMRRASLDELIPRVYDDVRPELHRIARLTLEAHLIKLQREGRCVRVGESWSVVEV